MGDRTPGHRQHVRCQPAMLNRQAKCQEREMEKHSLYNKKQYKISRSIELYQRIYSRVIHIQNVDSVCHYKGPISEKILRDMKANTRERNSFGHTIIGKVHFMTISLMCIKINNYHPEDYTDNFAQVLIE